MSTCQVSSWYMGFIHWFCCAEFVCLGNDTNGENVPFARDVQSVVFARRGKIREMRDS